MAPTNLIALTSSKKGQKSGRRRGGKGERLFKAVLSFLEHHDAGSPDDFLESTYCLPELMGHAKPATLQYLFRRAKTTARPANAATQDPSSYTPTPIDPHPKQVLEYDPNNPGYEVREDQPTLLQEVSPPDNTPPAPREFWQIQRQLVVHNQYEELKRKHEQLKIMYKRVSKQLKERKEQLKQKEEMCGELQISLSGMEEQKNQLEARVTVGMPSAELYERLEKENRAAQDTIEGLQRRLDTWKKTTQWKDLEHARQKSRLRETRAAHLQSQRNESHLSDQIREWEAKHRSLSDKHHQILTEYKTLRQLTARTTTDSHTQTEEMPWETHTGHEDPPAGLAQMASSDTTGPDSGRATEQLELNPTTPPVEEQPDPPRNLESMKEWLRKTDGFLGKIRKRKSKRKEDSKETTRRVRSKHRRAKTPPPVAEPTPSSQPAEQKTRDPTQALASVAALASPGRESLPLSRILDDEAVITQEEMNRIYSRLMVSTSSIVEEAPVEPVNVAAEESPPEPLPCGVHDSNPGTDDQTTIEKIIARVRPLIRAPVPQQPPPNEPPATIQGTEEDQLIVEEIIDLT